MKYICLYCKKYFVARPSARGKFCSHICYWKHRKEQKMYPPSRKGTTITEKHKQAIRDWHKNHPNFNDSKIGNIPWNKGLARPEIRGKNHPRWVGGVIKHPDKRIRNSVKYKSWRTQVFKRDDYTCQHCGKRGGELQADHIKPFSLFPRLRYVIKNGKTLCVKCHRKTNTYGSKIQLLKKTYGRKK